MANLQQHSFYTLSFMVSISNITIMVAVTLKYHKGQAGYGYQKIQSSYFQICANFYSDLSPKEATGKKPKQNKTKTKTKTKKKKSINEQPWNRTTLGSIFQLLLQLKKPLNLVLYLNSPS